jgi:hypothetical protein
MKGKVHAKAVSVWQFEAKRKFLGGAMVGGWMPSQASARAKVRHDQGSGANSAGSDPCFSQQRPLSAVSTLVVWRLCQPNLLSVLSAEVETVNRYDE